MGHCSCKGEWLWNQYLKTESPIIWPRTSIYDLDFKLPEAEEPRYEKYVRMRKTFLQENCLGLYMELLLNRKLFKYLNMTDDEARALVELIVRGVCRNID